MSLPTTARSRVALTFDAEHPDHPSSDPLGNLCRLLDVLAERDVHATFFVQGAWARAFPDAVDRIVGHGHRLGNHSHHHVRLPDLDDDAIRTDIALARSVIERFAPTGDRFRLPWGAGADGPHRVRIEHLLREQGYRHVGWNCGENDWMPGIAAAEISAPIVAAARARTGVCMPVLHSWPNPTSEAVETVVRELECDTDFVLIGAGGL